MEESLTPLPVDKPAKTMNFDQAIKEIMNGNRVTRVAWGNEDYCLLKDGWLSIYTKDKFHTWSISDGDMEGGDWIITT